jgi:YbbR domain-containing protein
VTRRWIWRRLTHNLIWKLASLALAVALWLAVVGQPELVAIQPVPLLYRNLPRNLLLLSDAPDQVRAELRGASGRLTRETLSEVFAAVDLSGVNNPGTQTFTLSESDFSLPQGIAFLRTVPSQVSLRFDRVFTKAVPVQIQLTGSLPPGYRLAAQSVRPESLQVSGPESSVRGIQLAKTDPVDLSSVRQNTDVKVNAFVAEQRAQFTSPPLVTVHLTIEKTEAVP